MGTFKIWLEVQSQKEDDIREVWNDIFRELVGGVSKADAVTYTLEKATEGLERKAPAGTLILGKLNAVFPRLLSIDQQYFRDRINDVTQWLGQNRVDNDATAPQRTVKTLMEKLFGTDEQSPYGNLFAKLFSSDAKASDGPDAEPMKTPQQTPDSMNQPPAPPQPPTPEQPAPEQPGQQPQVPAPMPGAPPTANPPMPAPPPLFKMGVY